MKAKLLSRQLRHARSWRREPLYRLRGSRRIAMMWRGFGFNLDMEP